MSQAIPPNDAPQPPAAPPRFGVQHVLALVAVAAITVLLFVFSNEVRQLGSAGYLGIFLTMLFTSATLILPAPGLAFVFVLGKVFPPLILGVVAGAGSTLGELTGFLAGFSGSGIVENIGVYHRIERAIKKYGLLTLVVLAAIPNPLFDAAGVAAGALGIKWWQFLLATFVGKTIKCVAVAYAGLYSLGVVEQMLGS